METRSERLKALISVKTITPLPRRPGIHFDTAEAVSALLGMYGLDKPAPELRHT